MTAVLALGSNLGDRLGHLRLAVEVLQPRAVSPVYETDPVGGVEQEAFLNAVVLCELTAEQAWGRAREAERRAGRTRDVRWGPRTLDVDVVDAPPPVPVGLDVPHPRAHERAFVLVPWADVQPDAVLPGHGPVRVLLDAVDRSGVRPHPEALR
ncbi:MAG TPA: 2-amino-4-hydroxy-6-hydroxymethyldihydropteridine diphosphokinase [Mycobacteriales bacterium]|nr:2-amino-4-hydroxy-6-hydroxymethyldihydropteridine diphosphokinase [Mycobacteriales bacterium]